ncbi:MAG: sigma factor [Chloroflexia bacterium]
MPDSDEQLVSQVAAGDSFAFEELYDRHVQQCYSLAHRLLGDTDRAEGVVHEAFLELWKDPSSYSTQKDKLLTWLLCLIYSRCDMRLSVDCFKALLTSEPRKVVRQYDYTTMQTYNFTE